MDNGYPARAITSPFRLPPSLAAPKAQPPPSTIPTDRLATQADRWEDGRGSSPSLPPPNGYSLNPRPASSSLNTLVTQTLLNQAQQVVTQQQQASQSPPPPAQQLLPFHQQQQQPPYTDPLSAMPMLHYGSAPPPPPGPPGSEPFYLNGAPRPMSYGAGMQPPMPPHPQSSMQSQQQQPVPYYALPKDVRMSQQFGGPPPPPPPMPPQQPVNYAQQPPSQPYAAHPPQIPPPLNYYGSGPSLPPQPPMTPQQQQQQDSGFVQRPPRTASVATDYSLPPLNHLSLAPSAPPPSTSTRPNYYANEQDGPPHKLSVTHPDQRMLANLRETAHSPPNDMHKKIAWAKQVLKFVERQQASAGESSRITDPMLVRWTDEALNLIIASASSNNPVPLALYLRGDLSSSGSFPSYRSKDPKAAFRDFEAAANGGLVKAWFRIGRAYEDFGDKRRAVSVYERGVEKNDCGSTYRLAMAYLLGQIGVTADVGKAVALLRRAADTADLDTPQPPYILGLLLSGEFDSPAVKLPKDAVLLNIEEAKWRMERSAYLAFGPAQYKMGFAYEYATLGCLFDPLLSVQYYALASQNGETEADMALSKWYLCGSEGNFDKNEALAVTFAEKAAARGLPSAEFALGYFNEVGISGPINLEVAKRWYSRAAAHGNEDAKERLDALQKSAKNVLSRVDHESQIDQKLVRKRTQAQARSNEQRARLAQTHARAPSHAPPPPLPQQGAYGYHAAPLPPASAPIPASHQLSPPSHALSSSQGRQSSVSGPAGQPAAPSVHTLRRRDTLKQVEAAAAAGWGPRPMPSRSSLDGPSSTPSGGRYQLNDSGPTGSPRRPATTTPAATTGPGSPEIQVRQRPATFAEMGIATTKAKKDECVVM